MTAEEYLEEQSDAVLAVSELAKRAGAKSFEIGHLDDNPARPRWWAMCLFPKAGKLYARQEFRDRPPGR